MAPAALAPQNTDYRDKQCMLGTTQSDGWAFWSLPLLHASVTKGIAFFSLLLFSSYFESVFGFQS